eukprot:COSAG02_NODE_68681_length_230_cov_11.274809_1_plen_44_part_10
MGLCEAAYVPARAVRPSPVSVRRVRTTSTGGSMVKQADFEAELE